jgi:hypothetical protein
VHSSGATELDRGAWELVLGGSREPVEPPAALGGGGTHGGSHAAATAENTGWSIEGGWGVGTICEQSDTDVDVGTVANEEVYGGGTRQQHNSNDYSNNRCNNSNSNAKPTGKEQWQHTEHIHQVNSTANAQQHRRRYSTPVRHGCDTVIQEHTGDHQQAIHALRPTGELQQGGKGLGVDARGWRRRWRHGQRRLRQQACSIDAKAKAGGSGGGGGDEDTPPQADAHPASPFLLSWLRIPFHSWMCGV